MTLTAGGARIRTLPAELRTIRRPLAVFAHPDDESFGLGAVLTALVDDGADVGTCCFTHGEASTLGEMNAAELHDARAHEFHTAAATLGCSVVALLDYRDGCLADEDADRLDGDVIDAARRHDADAFIVFDDSGVTGHADHRAATAAARRAAAQLGLPVLAWTIREGVAASLNDEFGTMFAGRPAESVDITLDADRTRQLAAIACHRSQSNNNPVLWRRLELTGDTEPLRWLTTPALTTTS